LPLSRLRFLVTGLVRVDVRAAFAFGILLVEVNVLGALLGRAFWLVVFTGLVAFVVVSVLASFSHAPTLTGAPYVLAYVLPVLARKSVASPDWL
jgi:hypothetical protein